MGSEIMLSSQSIQFLLTDPFFGHLLSALPKQASEEVADAGLGVADGRMVLLVNGHWAAEGGEGQLDVLRHELLHLVFMHPAELRRADFPWLFHLAADEAVGEGGRSGVWDKYYSLEAAWRRALAGLEPFPWTWALDWRAPGSPLAKHRHWTAAGAEADPAPAAAHARTLVQQAARRAGEATPEGLRLWLDGEARRNGELDWRRQLRLFSSASRRTRLRNTVRRPSRRYGTTPGLRMERGAHLLVAVDTSASVGEDTVARFFEEIHQLWWRQGADIRIVECDVAIRRIYDYRGQRPGFIYGRGGTLFDAPIEYANDSRDHPDGVIYFTDGEGPPPKTFCRYPLLWVIAGDKGAHLPGRRITIQN